MHRIPNCDHIYQMRPHKWATYATRHAGKYGVSWNVVILEVLQMLSLNLNASTALPASHSLLICAEASGCVLVKVTDNYYYNKY